MNIENLIDDPVGCGYLLRFCIRQFSAENLNFIIEVNRYREVFYQIHSIIQVPEWNLSWQELDLKITKNHFSPERLGFTLTQLVHELKKGDMNVKWSIYDRLCEEADKRLQKIWSTFISNDAETQICLSTEVLANTMRRISQVSVYGPEVLTEACFDPIKTLRGDILPRFKKSDLCQTLEQRRLECQQLPPASALTVTPPSNKLSTYDEGRDMIVTRRFTLEEIVSKGLLYAEFEEFLKRRVCVENLYCYRLIAIYEEHFDAKDFDTCNELGRLHHELSLLNACHYKMELSFSVLHFSMVASILFCI